jgi:hypothetical protein
MGMFERNAEGYLVGDLIAIKTKISCKWKVLDGEYVGMMSGAVSPFFLEISFVDLSGGMVTKEMYVSPQSASILDNNPRRQNVRWKDVSMNFIER